MQQPETRVYEKNDLQPGLNTSTIVQISSESVNSRVRAQAKAHRHTLVSIELPRGRHLGSDACIFWAQTPASPLRKGAQHLASNAYIFYAQERIQLYCARAHPYLHAPRDACVLFAHTK